MKREMEKRNRWKALLLLFFYITLVFIALRLILVVCNEYCSIPTGQKLILSLDAYQDSQTVNVKDQLLHRIHAQPFNLISFIIFGCAIIHTFCTHYFTALSQKLRNRNILQKKHPVDSFGVELLHFMGEVEVVFGIWVVPLLIMMTYAYDWQTATHYMEGLNYLEPMFVVVIMALASTKPIIKLAEACMKLFAKFGGESVQAWWWAILTIGPISGSFITEPGAMTITALLLAKQFYKLNPKPKLAYATLGLLFTNISVGGVLTNFAAPPVLMVSKAWNWDTEFMVRNFGWKAIIGILIINLVYYLIFRKEFVELEERRKIKSEIESKKDKKEKEIPKWIIIAHVVFLIWIVVHNHYPVIFIGTFLLFLGFYQATLAYQKAIDLKPAFLVGFFLAGLVVHGNLQGWWIEPILSKVSDHTLLILSTLLTSFNDNAAITFLATLIPSFDDALKYAVVAGAVSGGGLTVIANAPNPSGQAILGKYFDAGVAPFFLFLAAILPAIVMGLTFYLLRSF
jgi:hypothetical protein